MSKGRNSDDKSDSEKLGNWNERELRIEVEVEEVSEVRNVVSAVVREEEDEEEDEDGEDMTWRSDRQRCGVVE